LHALHALTPPPHAAVITGITDHPHQGPERLAQIAQKQTPFAAVLGCADSRVPAEILFDQGMGDVFVCRWGGRTAGWLTATRLHQRYTDAASAAQEDETSTHDEA
jgi:hypothetical protein